MRVAEALDEEQRLIGERDHAMKHDGLLAAEIAQLERRQGELSREEVQLLKEISRGLDVGTRREDNRAEKQETESVIEQKIAERNAALMASREADAEVGRLRFSELHVLAEDADVYTAAAQKALAALEAPYLAAQQAWAEAETRWSRLSSALNHHVQEHQEEEGVYSTPDKVDTAAPQFPLSDGGMTFVRARSGALVARPGAVAYIEKRKEQT